VKDAVIKITVLGYNPFRNQVNGQVELFSGSVRGSQNPDPDQGETGNLVGNGTGILKNVPGKYLPNHTYQHDGEYDYQAFFQNFIDGGFHWVYG
jgi:hypothetical protein